VLDALLQIVWFGLDLLLLLGLDSSFGMRGREDASRSTPASQLVVGAVVGFGVGFLFGYAIPGPILPAPLVPGMSLLLVPVLLSGAMQMWGVSRKRRGFAPSSLATWYGGAAVGFALAAGRLVGCMIS
jgi:hypothetical protein